MADYVTEAEVAAACGGTLPAGIGARLATAATEVVRVVIRESWLTGDPLPPVTPETTPAGVKQATLNIAANLWRVSTGGGSVDLDLLTQVPATMTQRLARDQAAVLAPWLSSGVMLA